MTENEQNVNEQQAPEAAADDVAGEEETTAERPAAEGSASAAEEPAAVPEEQLPPKERRRAARSTHTGGARPPRSAEERARERAERRREKARRRRVYRQRARERRASREPRPPVPAAEPKAGGARKVREGVVVADKADKTITVRIDVARQHRMYKKVVRTSSTLHAHDEDNAAHVGDTVRVVESRPISRSKRWRLVEVLERAR
jgi:small subunit ribosomal protein S17